MSKMAFENNISPEVAKSTLDWMAAQDQESTDALAESDKNDTDATEDSLRSEWGSEYRTNMNKIHGLLNSASEGIKDQIMGARLGDGTMLGSNAEALKVLADLALIQNPTTTLVPPGGDLHGALSDELKELQTLMGNKTSEYWKGPKAEANQARVRQLNEALAKAS